MAKHTPNFDKNEMKMINLFKVAFETGDIPNAIKKMVRIAFKKEKSKIMKKIKYTLTYLKLSVV